MANLARIDPPIGRHFTAHQQPVNLILKEKVMSLTGDAFDIKQDPGTGQDPFPIFKVDPSFLTSKKEFVGMDGRKIFDLRKDRLHLVHDYYKLEDENGKFCEIKKHFKVLGTKYTITFTSPTGAEQVLVMEGNWRDAVAEIKLEGTNTVCASIKRKSAFKSLSTFLFDQQTYMVTVAPGVDLAAVAAMCIVFDEWENEK
ncbi:unnamed protein product [Discula destructiva]